MAKFLTGLIPSPHNPITAAYRNPCKPQAPVVTHGNDFAQKSEDVCNVTLKVHDVRRDDVVVLKPCQQHVRIRNMTGTPGTMERIHEQKSQQICREIREQRQVETVICFKCTAFTSPHTDDGIL